jgi:hypothetical protein
MAVTKYGDVAKLVVGGCGGEWCQFRKFCEVLFRKFC